MPIKNILRNGYARAPRRIKSPLSYTQRALGKCHTRKVEATGKSAISDCGDSIRQRDIRQGNAGSEAGIRKVPYSAGYAQGTQLPASAEAAAPESYDRIRYHDAPELRAGVETLFTDSKETVGKDYLFQ